MTEFVVELPNLTLFVTPYAVQAPMSARKFAWEAKIAEQQTVATEHNRIMYRTRSATRMPDTPCQKQEAENQLRQGQEKVYDPAERVSATNQLVCVANTIIRIKVCGYVIFHCYKIISIQAKSFVLKSARSIVH